MKRDKVVNIKISITLLMMISLITVVVYQKIELSRKMYNTEYIEDNFNMAVYVDGEKTNEFPLKTSGKVFERMMCTNSGIANWDSISWTLTVNNITNPTNCNVYFVDESNTLRSKILAQESDAATIEAKGEPNFVVVPDGQISGLYATEDEYGMSYYYRGEKVSLANNVIFAEHQWKIIRINGDGSVRLIYNGKCPNNSCTINSEGAETTINNGLSYEWNLEHHNDAKYVGYMYGGDNGESSTTVGEAQKNQTNSNVKTVLDKWYEDNIEGTKYESYVVDNIFCNDRSIESGVGYGNETIWTYYKVSTRLEQTPPQPSFKCEQKNDRFTVNDKAIGNGALKYPVGLITADEVKYGGTSDDPNFQSSPYLLVGGAYWTFSPNNYFGEWGTVLVVQTDGNLSNNDTNGTLGLRAVLNLTAGAVILSGDGTASNPYKISS